MLVCIYLSSLSLSGCWSLVLSDSRVLVCITCCRWRTGCWTTSSRWWSMRWLEWAGPGWWHLSWLRLFFGKDQVRLHEGVRIYEGVRSKGTCGLRTYEGVRTCEGVIVWGHMRVWRSVHNNDDSLSFRSISSVIVVLSIVNHKNGWNYGRR